MSVAEHRPPLTKQLRSNNQWKVKVKVKSEKWKVKTTTTAHISHSQSNPIWSVCWSYVFFVSQLCSLRYYRFGTTKWTVIVVVTSHHWPCRVESNHKVWYFTPFQLKLKLGGFKYYDSRKVTQGMTTAKLLSYIDTAQIWVTAGPRAHLRRYERKELNEKNNKIGKDIGEHMVCTPTHKVAN